ncbi:MAG: FAD-binding protein [Pedosphaera sp.]|nr:FAD-binding protein [Pedosphaera sp.]
MTLWNRLPISFFSFLKGRGSKWEHQPRSNPCQEPLSLSSFVRSLFHSARQASVCNLPVEAVLAANQERRSSRRECLGNSSGVGALAFGAAIFGSSILPAVAGGSPPRIAIIGGGLAGLTCAYRLRSKGIESMVYEAAPRLGGRCFTRRGFFQRGPSR